jgi:hypothetical protein
MFERLLEDIYFVWDLWGGVWEAVLGIINANQ